MMFNKSSVIIYEELQIKTLALKQTVENIYRSLKYFNKNTVYCIKAFLC